MGRHLRYLVLGGGVAALLLAAACTTDLKPVEDRVGAVEQSVAAAQGKVTNTEQNLSALQGKVTSLEAKAGKIAAPAGEVEFMVTGAEWKGATSTDSLAAPTIDPKTLSDGYRYKAPGVFEPANPKRWEVSSYVWTPGAMTVLQGDKVTLRIFILNGDKHTSWVEGPDGATVLAEQEQNRGREYTMTFTATKVGHYLLHCDEHDPTMSAVITVLPRSE